MDGRPSQSTLLTAGFWRGTRGAVCGALLGLAFLGVGLLRATLRVLGGGRIQALTAADIRPLASYVGGLAAAGALLGVIWPRMRSRTATYAGFGAGGALVMIAIMAGDAGGLAALDGVEWVVVPLGGVLLGCAFARGLLGRTR